MPSSRRLTFTSEAANDLAAIVRQSAETWGRQQADRYRGQVDDALANLVRFPGIGQPRDELSPGLRSHPIGQHVAYYRATDDQLIVRRLVHRRQDIVGQLDG